MRFYLFIFIISVTMACNSAAENKNNLTVNSTKNGAANTAAPAKVPEFSYEIVNTYDHDPSAFTQGLIFYKGSLYEGTGGYKKRDNFASSLRKVDLETGKVERKFDLSDDYFGEGITILNDKIYQLTWKENTGFVYDISDFRLLREFRYSGEGWGLTNDGTNLIMSDGTHVLRFVNPETFETVRTLTILKENGKPQMFLNELEYIKGEIWANVWQEDEIIRIDPASGKILGRIDFTKLADEVYDKLPASDVLNGIAYDAETDRIFITGKKWDKLYEVRIVPKS